MVIEQRALSLRAVYDLYRTSLLNAKYYGHKLRLCSTISKTLDAILAIGATGSGVAGWQLWSTPSGKYIWAAIAGAASLFALLKPILDFNKRIENYTKLYYGHHLNSVRLRLIVERIAEIRCLSEQLSSEFDELRRNFLELSALDEPRPRRKRLLKLMKEVDEEVPAASLWIPPVPG